MRPLCSVIVPTYNAATYLAEALDSALEQTYQPIEVVVIDDGSTDDTAQVLDGYGDRIVRRYQSNAGVSAARNAGLGLAHGDYIAFLNADDVFAPTRLERCIELLEERPDITAVTTDAYMIDGDVATSRRWYGSFSRAGFPEPQAQLHAIVEWNFIFVLVVVRREALDRLGGFDSSCDRAEDLDMWIRLLLDGGRFARIAEPLAGCRLLPDSLLAAPAKQWYAHLTALDKHVEELWRRDVRAPGGVYFELAKRHARNGSRRRAATLAGMGLRCSDLQVLQRAQAGAGVARASFRMSCS